MCICEKGEKASEERRGGEERESIKEVKGGQKERGKREQRRTLY